ncbi:MAG: iron ABC transporter permease [Chitinophagaceae bacterium]|nr:iron ABC transporter permease [Chitinophagaceae bacterium]
MVISPGQVIAVLLNKIGIHLPVAYTEGMEGVLLQIRLPRVILAVLVGAGLAVAGASLQGLFRNPMADPVLIGISSGASLAAVATIVCLGGIASHYLLNTASFLGACLSAIILFRMGRSGGHTIVAMLLLAGLAVNALCNAMTGLITYSANNEQLRSVTFWLMGSLGGASWKLVLSLLPFIITPVLLLPLSAKALNAWSLGEQEAIHLGIDVRMLKARIMVLTTLAVGASVAVAGIIGFVGLIVPHIIRTLSGSDHRRLLPDSALFGAILLVLADLVSRTLLAPAELPIGIITAMLGTPLFIYLLYRYKKNYVKD